MRTRWRRLGVADRILLSCVIALTSSAVMCFTFSIVIELLNEMR